MAQAKKKMVEIRAETLGSLLLEAAPETKWIL
jgi:hypothetical protein